MITSVPTLYQEHHSTTQHVCHAAICLHVVYISGQKTVSYSASHPKHLSDSLCTDFAIKWNEVILNEPSLYPSHYVYRSLAKSSLVQSGTLALLRTCPLTTGQEVHENKRTNPYHFLMTLHLSGTMKFLIKIPLTQFQHLHRPLSRKFWGCVQCYRCAHSGPSSSCLEEGVQEPGPQVHARCPQACTEDRCGARVRWVG